MMISPAIGVIIEVENVETSRGMVVAKLFFFFFFFFFFEDPSPGSAIMHDGVDHLLSAFR